VFQSNVLAHYIIIRELEHLLTDASVIWTSSNTARRALYNSSDIQGFSCSDPYGCSKYVINLLSGHLNRAKGAKSYICDPGTFASNISFAMVPWYLSFFMILFFKLLQPFSPKLTGSTEKAVLSLLHIFHNRDLDPSKTGDVKVNEKQTKLHCNYM